MHTTTQQIIQDYNLFPKWLTHQLETHSKLRMTNREYAKFRSIMLCWIYDRRTAWNVRWCEGIFTMAFRKEIQFVDVRLTQADEADLAKFMEKHEHNLEEIHTKILGDGYTVKTGWYPDDECFAVFVMSAKDNPRNNNLILSARSDDLSEAIFMAAYKHYVMFGGKDWEVPKNQNNWG